MIIDISLLEAQCAVLRQDVFSEEKFECMMKLPAMAAFLEHEKMLSRTTDESMIRSAFSTAGESDCGGLLPEGIRDLSEQLCATAESISQNRCKFAVLALERIRKFSDCNIGENNTVYLYALGRDGGFSPREGELYINLLYSKDNWMDVLSHEMYHARELSEACEKKRMGYIQLTEETDEVGDMLVSELAEEGIATLIQRKGREIPRKEDVRFFLNQLKNWKYLTAPERKYLYHVLSSGPQRYAVASYLANKVLTAYGRKGLESWSMDGETVLFHKILEEVSSCDG